MRLSIAEFGIQILGVIVDQSIYQQDRYIFNKSGLIIRNRILFVRPYGISEVDDHFLTQE